MLAYTSTSKFHSVSKMVKLAHQYVFKSLLKTLGHMDSVTQGSTKKSSIYIASSLSFAVKSDWNEREKTRAGSTWGVRGSRVLGTAGVTGAAQPLPPPPPHRCCQITASPLTARRPRPLLSAFIQVGFRSKRETALSLSSIKLSHFQF